MPTICPPLPSFSVPLPNCVPIDRVELSWHTRQTSRSYFIKLHPFTHSPLKFSNIKKSLPALSRCFTQQRRSGLKDNCHNEIWTETILWHCWLAYCCSCFRHVYFGLMQIDAKSLRRLRAPRSPRALQPTLMQVCTLDPCYSIWGTTISIESIYRNPHKLIICFENRSLISNWARQRSSARITWKIQCRYRKAKCRKTLSQRLRHKVDVREYFQLAYQLTECSISFCKVIILDQSSKGKENYAKALEKTALDSIGYGSFGIRGDAPNDTTLLERRPRGAGSRIT